MVVVPRHASDAVDRGHEHAARARSSVKELFPLLAAPARCSVLAITCWPLAAAEERYVSLGKGEQRPAKVDGRSVRGSRRAE
eukprot:5688506-Pleurochrysis_carterae.AAC.2